MAVDLRSQVFEAIQTLKNGGVILYPSDTVWGLGCDPYNKEAVKKLFDIKKRASSKAVITLISDIGQLNQYVTDVPEIAWDLVEFAEDPLTVVYPNGKSVDEAILGEDKSIALRYVSKGFCNRLLHSFGRGITSTSANISGEASPAKFSEIAPEIVEACDFVVDQSLEEKTVKKPSRIVRLGINNEFELLRS